MCKGKCDRFISSRGGKNIFYSHDNPDNHYCAVCDARITWPTVFCPCCGYRMRSKPRNGRMSGLQGEVIEPEAIILTAK